MRVLFWLTCFGRFEDVLFIVKVKSLSRFQLFVTLWTVVYQAPLSMRFSRQEYWSGLPFPSPGDLPDPGIKPGSPALESDALTSEPPGCFQSMFKKNPWKITFFSLVSLLLLFFSHLVMTNSSQPHGLPNTRLPCPSPSPRVCSDSCPLSW